eukprot:UN09467
MHFLVSEGRIGQNINVPLVVFGGKLASKVKFPSCRTISIKKQFFRHVAFSRFVTKTYSKQCILCTNIRQKACCLLQQLSSIDSS